jgi:TP901 family phage tail tape measure protein
MADIQSNIRIDIQTAGALANVKNLQRQISEFHTQMAKGSAAAQASSANLQQNLINGINATGKFSASMTTVKTTTESFTNALEKNKLSIGQTFRFAGASTKTFGRLFQTEFNTINKVARERVKDLQTQFIKLGRDASGSMKAIAVRPTTLDMQSLGTQTAITAQKQQLFNQLLKQGSTNLLNWGKNTQWAGRQLMVGFTIPLSIFGTMAGRSFMRLEEQAIRFRRVYGDLFTTPEQTDQALKDMRGLADEFTSLGVAVSDTIALAGQVAQMGMVGKELRAQVTEATRLSVLGGMQQQEALDTTISLTNAFGIAVEDLTDKVNFLNAAENQTILSISDFNEAVPKAGAVVKQLGGGVEDLAFLLAAMREGGINASEGGNALKTSLGRLINPTQAARDRLGSFGIDIMGIVERNTGNLSATILELSRELDRLNPLDRARAIEQLFGKFQFARMSTLFANINREGSQASKVLELIAMDASDLGKIAERELGRVEESVATKFKKSLEQFQIALAPVGEAFLKLVTPLVEFGTKVLEAFDNMSDGAKSFAIGAVAVLGLIAPVALMIVGLIANGAANILKFVAVVRNGFQQATSSTNILGEQTSYMTSEQVKASAVAASLEQSHMKLQQRFTTEAAAVDKLTAAYIRAIAAQRGMGSAGAAVATGARRKYASGVVSVPGSGRGDKVPAMLEPGEAVIPRDMAEKFRPLIAAMVTDNVPGFKLGTTGVDRAHLTAPMSSRSQAFQQAIEIKGLQELAAKFPQFIKVVSNLVMELPKRLNQQLKSGGATIQEFSQGFDSRKDKLMLSAKLGGAQDTPETRKALAQIEKAIKDRAIALAKATKDQKVTDQILQKATREVIAEQKKKKGVIRNSALALEKASKQAGQVRVEPTVAQVRSGLASGEFTQRADGRVFAAGQQIARQSQSRIRPSDPRNLTASYARQEIMSTQANIKAKNENTVATRQVTQTKKKQAQAVSQSAEFERRSIAARKGWETRRARQSDGAGQVAAPAVAGQNLNRMNNIIMSTSFALTALAGAGSMMGGTIGKISEQLFKFSGILFALMSVTQLLTQMKIAEIAVTKKAAASKFLEGVGGFTGGAKGLAGIGNIFRNLGGVIKVVIGGFMKFIPLIGAAIIAFSVFKLFADQKKQIQAVGDAANFSADQLKTLGGILNTQVRTTDFAGAFTGGQQTGEQLSATEAVVQSEDFQKQFGEQIKAIGKMSRDEAELTLKALATQLSASGFEEEAVSAILNAIKVKAEQTGLDISFGSIKFSSEESLAQIQEVAQGSAEQFSTAFENSSGWQQFQKNVFAWAPMGPLAQQISSTAGQFASLFQAVKIGFESGDLSAEQFNEQLNGIVNSLSEIDPEFLAELIPEIAERLGIEEQLEGLESVSDQLLLVKAAAAGVQIDETTLRLLKEASEAGADAGTVRAASRARQDLNKKIRQTAIETEKANKAEAERVEYDQLMEKANETLDEKIENMQNEIAAYEILTAAGFSAAEAIDAVSDATIANAIVNASTSGDREALISQLREVAALQGQVAEIRGTARSGGGGGQKSPYAQVIENLQNEQKELQNAAIAYEKLRQAGIDAGKAFELTADSAMAAAIASTQVGTAKWNQLMQMISAVRQLELQSEVGLARAFNRMMSNANTIYDLQEIRINRRFNRSLQRLEDIAWKAKQQIQKLQDDIERRQRFIELTITRPLEQLQNESAIMSNDLAIMDKQAEEINKKYDDQKKALQDISRINKDIVNQQKTQLSLADALSQGDISAAASQMQQIRAQRAEASRTSLMDALDAAREAEISGLRGRDTGMTRDQIAQREFEIQQQTFQLEQRRRELMLEMRIIEDQIYEIQTTTLRAAEREIEALQRQRDIQLRAIQDRRDAWQEAQLAMEVAKIAQDEYNMAVAMGNSIVNSMNMTWKDITSKIHTISFRYVATNSPPRGVSISTTNIGLPTPNATVGRTRNLSSGGQVKYMANGGSVMMRGGAPRYMAAGGESISSRNTDSVPAMLTPGEFVVNRRATQKFLPLLKSMNSNFSLAGSQMMTDPNIVSPGTQATIVNNFSPRTNVSDNSNTVYNYSLSVNVEGSDAQPEDIARVVIDQIRKIDNQALRAQRISR